MHSEMHAAKLDACPHESTHSTHQWPPRRIHSPGPRTTSLRRRPCPRTRSARREWPRWSPRRPMRVAPIRVQTRAAFGLRARPRARAARPPNEGGNQSRHQRSSEVIRGHHRSSEVIRSHQRSSRECRPLMRQAIGHTHQADEGGNRAHSAAIIARQQLAHLGRARGALLDEERRLGHLIMEAISGVIRGHQWRHQRPSVLIRHLRSQRGHAAVGMRRPN